MEQERRAMRIGLAAISVAVLGKLVSGGLFSPVMALLNKPEVASFLLYMETGRALSVTRDETVPETTAAARPTEPMPQGTHLQFAREDGALLQITDTFGTAPDLTALLLQPLTWDLDSGEPTVLILHTHATESYTHTGGYTETSAYRTLDEHYNMLRVGDQVAQALEAQGITVLHDRTLHDHPSYTGSYSASRETAQAYLQEYPSIRIVLDLHRDAIALSNGQQLRTAATVNGRESAQLMLVVGTSLGGLSHSGWQENLAFAVKLQATLEKNWPGITRPINFRRERFNQDLTSGALLVEVGSAGNTLDESLVAAETLAEALALLAHGTG